MSDSNKPDTTALAGDAAPSSARSVSGSNQTITPYAVCQT